MSNNLTASDVSYSWLKTIRQQNFDHYSVVLIGTGMMAQQYGVALNQMKIKNVQVISNTRKEGKNFCKKFGFKKYLFGDFNENIKKLHPADLVIVALPINLLLDATKKLLKNDFSNILIEKPGSLHISKLTDLSELVKNQNIRIGYNRLIYPSFLKLKDILNTEDISSCTFDFTEWTHKIIFDKYVPEVYQRWGISNSLHVISMAFELIGMPKKLKSFQNGSLDWHNAGSAFVGSGISGSKIPFTYHANWKSSGRWGIEIMTNKGKYRLSPLEELHFCEIGSIKWKKIKLFYPFPSVKVGVSEEIASMLSNESNIQTYMPSIKQAISYNKVASKIFGYN